MPDKGHFLNLPSHTTYAEPAPDYYHIFWSYAIIALVIVIIGIILLMPGLTISNIIITIAWVLATLAFLTASFYTMYHSVGLWYYFTIIVTILLILFSIIWAGEYHNRAPIPEAANQGWFVGITAVIVVGLMILLAATIQSSDDKSYSIPGAVVALVVWLILGFF